MRVLHVAELVSGSHRKKRHHKQPSTRSSTRAMGPYLRSMAMLFRWRASLAYLPLASRSADDLDTTVSSRSPRPSTSWMFCVMIFCTSARSSLSLLRLRCVRVST